MTEEEAEEPVAEGAEPGGRPHVPDLVTAGVLLLLAAGVVVETAGYPASLVPGAPGPAFFPRFLAGILALLALLLGVRALRGGAAGGPTGAETPDATGEERVRSRAGRIGLALLLIVGFVAAVDAAGVFLLLPPLLAGVMAIMGERRPAALVAVPLLFDLFVYGVFFRLFGVDLPTLLL